jgi:hypothetical protein
MPETELYGVMLIRPCCFGADERIAGLRTVVERNFEGQWKRGWAVVVGDWKEPSCQEKK